MKYTFAQYEEAAAVLRSRIGDFQPEVAMVLGSGLGFMAEQAQNAIAVDYKDIPGFRVSTAPGHAGRLVFGELGGKKVAVMQGRLHAYEGYTFEETCFPIRVLRLLGCDKLIITNASGGVDLSFRPGDIMLITDHMKFFPDSPLWGENLPEFGVRFPDSTYLYTPALQDVARQAAKEENIALQEGVYMYFPGPSYETPAEIRAIRVLGGNAVGMSTVPEVITAGHCGMQVLGFSLISNAAAGITDKPLSEQEVLDAAEAAKGRFSSLVTACLRKI
jgi:purine-nucleoside phosphorylase